MFSRRSNKDLTTLGDSNYPSADMLAVGNCDLFGLIDDCFMAQFLAAGLLKPVEQTTPDHLINKENDKCDNLRSTTIIR